MDIKELKSHIRIEEIIGQSLNLFGRGTWLSCKEHSSLKVNVDTQTYSWYSKDEFGDVFHWVQRYILPNCSFPEAIRYLQEYATHEAHAVTEKAPDVKLDPTLADFYHEILIGTPAALDWWKKRGVTNAQIQQFKLGYKPDHWNLGAASTIPYFDASKLVNMRNRIWFAEGEDPRYLPEVKGIGVKLFNTDALENDTVIITEGEIKAMISQRFGYPTVAVPGMMLMPEEFLPRFKNKVVYICLDYKLSHNKSQSVYEIKWVKLMKLFAKEIRIIAMSDKLDDYLLRGSIYVDSFANLFKKAKIMI